ncbi:DUF503 domain-containing protein [Shouchella lehensis]|uniref:YlxP-like protein n=2 Tax=Shouchella lehensis TaxID=300825 RepID=A0A060LX66_9BACI|nr:DUF503 domain-containing protein [Shouchella lehensis]AIC94792.1 hypothetical protein BleG1_2214 [Shouchella lehensis G1]MBG9784348.1 hypothetical protein [Shouchella lehensis]RQW20640.1 DUF503 domain-containing protein [Bacillus sp. C1-1]TES50659.1 DUF503 domain-containing protein [Shouchella lehensis]
MHVAVVRCECFIFMAQSLKDKRSVVKSIVTRMRQRLNVSVAETDHQNVWQRAELTIAAVGSSKQSVETELQKALDLLDRHDEAERTLTDWEWV